MEGSESSKGSRKGSVEMEKLPSSSGSRTPPNELENETSGGGSDPSIASVGASSSSASASGSKSSSLSRGPVVNITDESGKSRSLDNKVKIKSFFCNH